MSAGSAAPLTGRRKRTRRINSSAQLKIGSRANNLIFANKFKLIWVVQSSAQKYTAFLSPQNRCGLPQRNETHRSWNLQVRAAETGIRVRRSSDDSSNGCAPNDRAQARRKILIFANNVFLSEPQNGRTKIRSIVQRLQRAFGRKTKNAAVATSIAWLPFPDESGPFRQL